MKTNYQFGISVVLPVYNGMPLLKESVESVLIQKDVDFELLIGEDKSSDGSLAYLTSLNNNRVRIIKNPKNLGLFGNLNFLIREAEYNIIHLWSQDDIMLPGCLQKTAAYHWRNPHIGYAFCKYRFIDEFGKDVGANPITKHQSMSVENHAITSLVTGSAPGNIACVSFRKENIEQISFFKENMKYAADFDTWCRLTADKPVGIIQQYLIKLRRHPGQLSRQPDMWIFRLKENKSIYEEFFKRVPAKKQKYVKRGLNWRIYTQYFALLIKLIRIKEFRLAVNYYKELRSQTPILPVILSYSILLIARRLKIHQKLLSKLYYNKL